MKRALIVLAVLVLIATPVMAAENLDTSRGKYVTPNSYVTNYLNSNEYFHHSHIYDAQENPLGVGVDLKVFDFKKANMSLLGIDSIVIEGRKDFANESHSIYGVLVWDLTALYQ